MPRPTPSTSAAQLPAGVPFSRLLLSRLPLPLLLLLLSALLLLPTACAEPASDSTFTPDPRHDPTADSIVHAWIDGIGGMERYWEMETARFTLTTEWWDVERPRIRRTRPRYITIARPEGQELARLERWEGDNYIQQGWDGRQPWATLNGEFLEPGHMDRDQVEYVASDVNYWIALPYKLRDPGLTLHYDGRDGESRHTVRVTFDEGVGDHQDVWHYFFVDGELWPVEIRYQEAGSTSVSRTRWEDIQQVDGYTFVGRRVHLNADDRITRVLYTTDFELNPELPPELFSEP